MPDFVSINSVQNGSTSVVAHFGETVDRGGTDVEPAGFQHHRHEGQTSEQIVACVGGRLPQSVMRGVRAVMTAKGMKPPLDQHEVHGFVCANRQPVVYECAGKGVAEAPGNVEGEVNGREFDMRKSVQHGDLSGKGTCAPAVRHFVGREQFGMRRAARPVGHLHVKDVRQSPGPPVSRHGSGTHDLLARIGGIKDGSDGRGNAGHDHRLMALAR